MAVFAWRSSIPLVALRNSRGVPLNFTEAADLIQRSAEGASGIYNAPCGTIGLRRLKTILALVG
jgi:ATP-dependent protease HslVU (ClpYQ) ATPase subunit